MPTTTYPHKKFESDWRQRVTFTSELLRPLYFAYEPRTWWLDTSLIHEETSFFGYLQNQHQGLLEVAQLDMPGLSHLNTEPVAVTATFTLGRDPVLCCHFYNQEIEIRLPGEVASWDQEVSLAAARSEMKNWRRNAA